jgi:DNA-binding transcriptional regulator YbjK
LIQLEILRERQKHLEERIRQLEQELTQAYTTLGRREKELEQLKQQYADLNTRYEVLKTELRHAQASLRQNSQATTQKKTKAKLSAFFASIVFLLSSIVANVGTSFLTSIPPNISLGWLILSVATIVYIMGALITIVFVSEGGS